MNLPSYCIELVLVITTLQASYNYLLTYHTKPKLTNLQSVNVIKKTLGKKLTTNLPKLTNTTRLGG